MLVAELVLPPNSVLVFCTGAEPRRSMELLWQASEGPADSVPAGQRPAVATAAGVPPCFCKAAAWLCGSLCHALGHLRCRHPPHCPPPLPGSPHPSPCHCGTPQTALPQKGCKGCAAIHCRRSAASCAPHSTMLHSCVHQQFIPSACTYRAGEQIEQTCLASVVLAGFAPKLMCTNL